VTTTQAKPTKPNEAKLTLGIGKPATHETKAAPEAKVSLKAICSELKRDPRVAREKLRIAVREAKKYPELAKAHKPRSAWEWPKASPAEKGARALHLPCRSYALGNKESEAVSLPCSGHRCRPQSQRDPIRRIRRVRGEELVASIGKA
jgi:hypothetical protein